MRFSKLKEITGHAAGIYSVAYSGDHIYSASADRFLARWKFDEGLQDKFSIRFGDPVYSVAICDSSQLLIAGTSSGDLHIFCLKEKKELHFFKQHISAVFCISVNPNSGHVYTGDAEGNLGVWRIHDQQLLLFMPIAAGKIRRVVPNDDGKLIAVCCENGSLKVFDTEFFNEQFAFKAHEGGVASAVFTDGSECIVSGGKDAWLRKWDLRTGEETISIPAHNFVVYDLLTLSDGELVVSASRDKTIKVWKTADLDFVQRLDHKEGGHRHSVNTLCKVDENTFVSAGDDKRIIVWGSSVNP
jgi:WD40 repeat protein